MLSTLTQKTKILKHAIKKGVLPINTRPPPFSKNPIQNTNERREKKMVRKIINKAISAVTTTLLAFTTLASAIPVTTYAAATKDSIQKSTTKITSKNKDKAAGYGTFDFEANSSGYTFSHSSNLKKAVKTGSDKDWIWEDRNQGSADDKLKKLIGNAYISKLNTDSSFWVKYSNVKKVDDEGNQLGNYDVKVVFDNAGGSISNAEGHDIAIFDGQLGAVRFRGYKHIRCTIYVYKHGTSTLISGADDKLHFRQHEVFSFRISKYHSLFFFLANHC